MPASVNTLTDIYLDCVKKIVDVMDKAKGRFDVQAYFWTQTVNNLHLTLTIQL